MDRLSKEVDKWVSRIVRLNLKLTRVAFRAWDTEDAIMDAMTAKLIQSRKNSVEKLDAEIQEFKRLEDTAADAVLKLTYKNQRTIREARRAKLHEELVALEQAAAASDRQLEVPGAGRPKR